ncbi:hypothetical protein D3C80_2174480 [compost metagenome]
MRPRDLRQLVYCIAIGLLRQQAKSLFLLQPQQAAMLANPVQHGQRLAERQEMPIQPQRLLNLFI